MKWINGLFFFTVLLKADYAVSQRRIDSLVAAHVGVFMANHEHVGLSIGVTRDGVDHTYNYGTIDREKNSRPTAHTIYEIASITKSFTGILLAHAVLDGKVALNDDIRKYLPGPYPNLAYGDHPIRIVDLANHTSGLHKFIPVLEPGRSPDEIAARYSNYSRQQFLADLRTVRIDTIPGTRYEYSNAGTQVIGIILENVYHMSYGALVQQFITGPNHMRDTKLLLSKSDSVNVAKGYDKDGRPMPDVTFWRSIPAAAYLKSTVSDMLLYMLLNLNERDPAIALAHKPTFSHTDEGDADIGLCWFSKVMPNGFRKVDHAGGSFGSTSYCLMYPALQLGIVCLANDASPDTEHELRVLAAAILDQLLPVHR